jgi:AmmeMemoRadiSam system protein A
MTADPPAAGVRRDHPTLVTHEDVAVTGVLSVAHRRALLDVALAAVAHTLLTDRRRLPVDAELPGWLRQPAATFVSLHRSGSLLGCIGTLEAYQSLGRDVAEHAVAAAFHDPRLPPVDGDDFDRMEVEVAVLSRLEPLRVRSRAELLSGLRPGLDGLVVTSGDRRATFLPAVWRSVSGPADFVALLWRKAGLEPGAWPVDLRLHTYSVAECLDPGPRDLAAWMP